jgi:hypothetical protein
MEENKGGVNIPVCLCVTEIQTEIHQRPGPGAVDHGCEWSMIKQIGYWRKDHGDMVNVLGSDSMKVQSTGLNIL